MPAMRDGRPWECCRIPGWLLAAAASVLVTSPLLGVGFQGDQRTWMYILMNETSGNPWEVIARTVRNIDYFLSVGNCRSLGRMLTDLEHVFYMETALATGIPPHLVHGFTRLAMIALLAVAALRFLESLERSAGLGQPGHDHGSPDPLLLSGNCLLYTSPSPRDGLLSRMPSSA